MDLPNMAVQTTGARVLLDSTLCYAILARMAALSRVRFHAVAGQGVAAFVAAAATGLWADERSWSVVARALWLGGGGLSAMGGLSVWCAVIVVVTGGKVIVVAA